MAKNSWWPFPMQATRKLTIGDCIEGWLLRPFLTASFVIKGGYNITTTYDINSAPLVLHGIRVANIRTLLKLSNFVRAGSFLSMPFLIIVRSSWATLFPFHLNLPWNDFGLIHFLRFFE
jgi:hypothetical protein